MVGGFVQSATDCRIQIQSVGPAVVGLIRVVAPAPGGRGAPCAPFPAPVFSSARQQDGPQADLLLRQVLRRALRVPVSSACGEGRPARSDPVVGARDPSEASVRAAALCVALQGSQELRGLLDGWATPRPGVHDRTGPHCPGGEVPRKAPGGDYRESDG